MDGEQRRSKVLDQEEEKNRAEESENEWWTWQKEIHSGILKATRDKCFKKEGVKNNAFKNHIHQDDY